MQTRGQKKTLANGLNPEMAAKAGNALQKYVMENTRLGIPMFLAEEAPHAHGQLVLQFFLQVSEWRLPGHRN